MAHRLTSIADRTKEFLRGLEAHEVRKAPDDDKARERGARESMRQFARFGVPPLHGSQKEAAGWNFNRNEYVRHYRGSAYVAIGAIARKVAMQEPIVARRTVRAGKKRWDEVSNHPLADIFNNPNPHMVSYDLWYHTIGWRLTCGTAYWWKARNGLGLPGHLWVLPSQWVWAIPSRDKFIGEYLVKGVWAHPEKLPAEDVVQMSEPNLDWAGTGRFYGMPSMAAGDKMLELEEAMLKRLVHKFRNYAPPGLHYETDEELGVDEFEQMYAQLIAQHMNAEDTGLPILTHGGMKARVPGEGGADLDYQGGLNAALEYGLAINGVPKAVVGMVADANRANAEASLLTWATNTINPLLAHTGQCLTKGLASEYDDDIEVYFPPVEVHEADQIRKDIETAVKAGATTPNEVREVLLDRPVFPNGGNRPLVSAGMDQAPFSTDKNDPTLTEPEEDDDIDPSADPADDEVDEEVDTDDEGNPAASGVAASKFFRVGGSAKQSDAAGKVTGHPLAVHPQAAGNGPRQIA